MHRNVKHELTIESSQKDIWWLTENVGGQDILPALEARWGI